MKYYLFNFDYITVEVNDPSDLTDDEFKELAKQENGFIFESTEDFESAFNAELFSTHTHQLRIVEDPKS